LSDFSFPQLLKEHRLSALRRGNPDRYGAFTKRKQQAAKIKIALSEDESSDIPQVRGSFVPTRAEILSLPLPGNNRQGQLPDSFGFSAAPHSNQSSLRWQTAPDGLLRGTRSQAGRDRLAQLESRQAGSIAARLTYPLSRAKDCDMQYATT
jgi:hypothetical protein